MICSACGTPNPPGMRFCGMCGTPLERQVTGRERRRVSVVFIDLAAFTTLTRGLDPEELRDLADEVLTVVAGIIEDFDGYVDAFRGDGLIALFGAPHSHPDDAHRAVIAAAAALRAIEAIGRGRGTPLRGRAGINTGVVIAGAVGSGRVRSYTVMGSAVNLAARFEEAAVPGQVWVGAETYEATRHRLLYEPTEELVLTGFPSVTNAYRLISTIDHRESDPYAHLAFVGRKAEMEELHRRHRDVVASGLPQEVWLVGEAGRGKTRLLREFVATLGPRAQVLWVEVRPTEDFTWNLLESQLFDTLENEEERVRQQKVLTVLQRALPGESRWHRAILSSLDLEQVKTWTRLERRTVDRTNVAWRDLLSGLIHNGGQHDAVIMVVENEPRDTTLLEFLTLLKEAQAPILVLRSSRGRAVPEDAERIPLRPLSTDESMAVLTQLASPMLKLASDALIYQVGGVPAYILELGRALSITQDGSFSGSLASLLQSRLDMIDTGARLLLAQAALTGEAAWESLLMALSGSTDGHEIRILADENLLLKQASSSIPGDVEYRFQSELLRHAVLRMIPFSDRPQLHLRVATWLEQNAPLALSELIAEHFERGGSPDAAYAHYLAAADLAVSRGDDARAEDLFERLLALDLGPELLAEGALTFAQAAIARHDRRLADLQLQRAGGWIEACVGEAKTELERVRRQLEMDVNTLL